MTTLCDCPQKVILLNLLLSAYDSTMRMNTGLMAVIGAIFMASAVCTHADDGYFLSMHQKGQLISYGRIQDDKGIWYDIWLCPGYVPPTRYAWENIKASGSDFAEYAGEVKYKKLGSQSKSCLSWAFKDCLHGFIIKGSPKAWKEYFSTAGERTHKRLFGWWLAYPWALFESVVDTTFRTVVGTVGSASGLTTALAIVPSYHALDSAVCGVWHLGVQGTIIPVVGITWNTVITPPMAILGQKPAPERVDGFWVVQLSKADSGVNAWSGGGQLSADDIANLARWTKAISAEAGQLRAEIKKAEALRNEESRRIASEYGKKVSSLRKKETEQVSSRIEQIISSNQVSQYECRRFVLNSDQIAQLRSYLKKEGMADAGIQECINILYVYPPSKLYTQQDKGKPVQRDPSKYDQKTDPLRQGIRVIEKSDAIDDMVK